MAKAISQLNPSGGQDLGAFIATLINFDSTRPKSDRKKTSEEVLLEKYQRAILDKARKSYEWQEFAQYLRVEKGENNRVVVYLDAPDSVRERAELLEYGTPGAVANPLMRVSEAEFNEDFEFKRMIRL